MCLLSHDDSCWACDSLIQKLDIFRCLLQLHHCVMSYCQTTVVVGMAHKRMSLLEYGGGGGGEILARGANAALTETLRYL